jgi:hypothetical protein
VRREIEPTLCLVSHLPALVQSRSTSPVQIICTFCIKEALENKASMKYLNILFLVVFVFPLNASIQNIPDQDIRKIKSLFEYLIYEHDFAYAIFGSKPMALADICLWMPDVPSHRYFHAQTLLVQREEELKAWYKHKNEFKLKNFIVLDQENDLFDCLVFVLIHKSNMIALLHKHEAIFKKVIGAAFSPELFLEQIEQRKVSLAQAIHHHYGLLGIMLGYGVKNSMSSP